MKKAYNTPTTAIYEIELTSMIAASQQLDQNKDAQDVTISNEQQDAFPSRRPSMWDEEEEEE